MTESSTNGYRHGDEGVTVHFNIHMDPSKGPAQSEDLVGVIRSEIQSAQNATESVLGGLVIDEESVEIQGEAPAAADRAEDPLIAPPDFHNT
jgi:hypothetical protein